MKLIKDIYYVNTNCEEQTLDLYLPDCEEFPVFVYFHGGGLDGGTKNDYSDMGEYLADNGIAFVCINYRKYPYAVYPDFICDAAASVAWTFKNINSYGKCNKIYVGGSSAGGYISMMLCFDKCYLAPFGINPMQITGFIHDAGQPTVHFNVLRERGIDSKRVIIDEAAPLYHVGTSTEYSPMLFIVSDNDMENRYEQTLLMMATLKHFGYSKYSLKVMHGTHCQYVHSKDENGVSVLTKLVHDAIKNNFK